MKKYNLIDTVEKLQKLDAYLLPGNKQAFQFMSYDTELNGLNLFVNSIIGFSISVNDTEGYYIPFVKWVPDTSFSKVRTINKQKYTVYPDGCFVCIWTGEVLPEFFKPKDYRAPEGIIAYLRRWITNQNLIMHNAPFDVNHTYICMGIDMKENLWMDTLLGSHIINENSPNGLKETAIEFKSLLNLDPNEAANQEQIEMGASVIKNGGDVTKGGKAKSIWRADLEVLSKYACADTFLTFGIHKVELDKISSEMGPKAIDWFLGEEVMPLCREVVIPMKRKGFYIDVPYFQELKETVKIKLDALEDQLIKDITPYLDTFSLGKGISDVVKPCNIIREIIEIEGLEIPKKLDKKTNQRKESLAKPVVAKEYQNNPHWVWGYILGEDELKYSDTKLNEIKQTIYERKEKRRYRFNVRAPSHLSWLFCDKLGLNKASLPQTKSAKKDKPIAQMNYDTLKDFMLPEWDWVKNLMVYKKLYKLYNSYILPAVNLNIDGWLYMNMNQAGTVTGRFSCSGGFNLQTLPRVEELEECFNCKSDQITITQPYIKLLGNMDCSNCGFHEEDITMPSGIKAGFIKPPGYKIVNADFSSLEPRCFAYKSNDEGIKDIYKKNLDIYSKFYCDMLDDANEYSPDPKDANFLKKVAKKKRNFVKPVVLSIPYGASPFQVASQLNLKTKRKNRKTGEWEECLDIKQGEQFIRKYYDAFPDLEQYTIDQENKCINQGYSDSDYGRRKHFKSVPTIKRVLLDITGLTVYDFIHSQAFKFRDKIAMECESNWFNPNTNGYATMTLTETHLSNIAKSLKIGMDVVLKEGGWGYIRRLIKTDINTSRNWPIQTLAGHITNMSMLETTRFYKQNGVDGWVSLQIHDELCCYVKEEQAQAGADLLQIGMEKNIYSMGIDVEMIAEPIICDTVKEAK